MWSQCGLEPPNSRSAHSLEEAGVTLEEAHLVLAGAGLAGLRHDDREAAALALIAVVAARNRGDLERPFRRLLPEDMTAGR